VSGHNPGMSIDHVSPRASQETTHKHFTRNIAISTPTRVTDDSFSAQLLLDEGNDILTDHLTGEHIQGVALVEAARQMWTAVTEMFLRQGDEQVRLVLDQLSAKFTKYVFPLPTEMRMRL